MALTLDARPYALTAAHLQFDRRTRISNRSRSRLVCSAATDGVHQTAAAAGGGASLDQQQQQQQQQQAYYREFALSRRNLLASSAGLALIGGARPVVDHGGQPLPPAPLRNPGPAADAGSLEEVEAPGWRFPREQQGLHQSACKRPALMVGNYCHDRLLLPGGQQATVLGGAVSYIAAVYDALGLDAQVVSKVGPDFAYTADAGVLAHPPTVVPGRFTTRFVADLSSGSGGGGGGGPAQRVLYASHVCEPVYARDLPPVPAAAGGGGGGCAFEVGVAAGVAGEVLPETVARMAETARTLIVDAQSMVRRVVLDPHPHPHPETAPAAGVVEVGLCRLEDTPYATLIPRVAFLKVARDEAPFLDLAAVRKTTCVLVTEGALGCRVLQGADGEVRVPAVPAPAVLDRTGAGDSFLAGFSAGVVLGLPVEKAVRLGNYFGAVAVSQVGVPRFSASQLQYAASLLL